MCVARRVELIEAVWGLGAQLEACLKQIFAKYCTPRPPPESAAEPPEGAFLSQDGLDEWARDTNGAPFDEATKEELLEFMDVTEDGGLTSVNSVLAIVACVD